MLRTISFSSDTDQSVEDQPTCYGYLALTNQLLGEEQIKMYLKKSYPKCQHESVITNGCYRSHHQYIINNFTQIRLNQYPNMSQPKISAFFPNKSFTNLSKIARWKSSNLINEDIPGLYIQPQPKDYNKMMDQIYVQYGYIPNYERTLMFFPLYLEKHLKLSKELFETHHTKQPLIYFLAICAAAELGCLYFVSRFVKKYKQCGGQDSWLTQGAYPKKFQFLLQLNRKLARCLWQIDSELITNIKMSYVELTFLCFVMTYVHQMSTICLSMGLQEEEKCDILNIDEAREIIEKYREQTYLTQAKGKTSKVSTFFVIEEEATERNSGKTRKQIKRQEKRLESQTQIQGYMREIAKDLNNQQLYSSTYSCFSPLLSHQRVEKRQQQLFAPIDYSEYSFEFNSYPILKQMASEPSDLFFDLLQTAQTMTLHNLQSQKCIKVKSTKGFRKSISYYSKNLCGFTHLDYDYKNNYKKYLSLPLKFLLRLMTFSPLHISKQVIDEINMEEGQIACFDNAHAATIIASTKMSMALMMVTRAFQLQEQ